MLKVLSAEKAEHFLHVDTKWQLRFPWTLDILL